MPGKSPNGGAPRPNSADRITGRSAGRQLLVPLAIALAGTLLVYHRGLLFPFALDDYTYLFRAAGIDPDPFTLRRLLSTRLFYGLGYELFGVSNPLPWHVVAFALHVANALWVYVLSLHVGAGRGTARLATGLFAAGPIAFTVLYWIAGVQELSSSFFLLAAMWVATRPGRARFAAVPLYGMAVLCKESVLVAPLVLPFLLGRRAVPVALLQIGLGVGLFFGAGLHARAVDANLASPYATSYGAPFFMNLATGVAWALTPWRPYPDRVTEADPALVPWGAALLVVIPFLVMARARRLARHLALAVVWFLALLLPALPLRQHFYAYYLYLPQIPLVVVFAAALLAMAGHAAQRWGARPGSLRLGASLAALGLCVGFGLRNAHTHETLTLVNSFVPHDSVIRYGHVSGSLYQQIRAAKLDASTRRIAVVLLDIGKGSVTPTSRKQAPGAVRIRTFPAKTAMRDGRFVRLHFPHLEGGFADSLTAADEAPGTAFFLCQGLADLERLPDAAAAQGLLAYADFFQGRYAQAERRAQQALALRADEIGAQLVLAGAHAAQGRNAEAERILAAVDVNALPASLRTFVEQLREFMASGAGGTDGAGVREAPGTTRPPG